MNGSFIEANFHRIQNQIIEAKKLALYPNPVTLIAVSKKQPVEAIERLYALGQRDFGENYVQELCEKAELLKERGCHEIRWHFLGHLQTNKVKMLLRYVTLIHSIDSEKLALELSKRWKERSSNKLPLFIEVNIDREPNKSGVSPESVPHLAQTISRMEVFDIRGLMCIPSAEKDPRSSFKNLRELEIKTRPLTQGMLSMGMSNDFAVAIQEGATHIRVGTLLFGARPR